jgi:hypothetical protein
MSESIKRYSLIEEELDDYIYEKNEHRKGSQLMNTFFRFVKDKKTISFSFLVPSSYYLRAELLCEDISIVSEECFTQTDLTYILFKDFLANVRIMADHHKIYSELKTRDNRPLVIRVNGMEQPQLSPSKLKDYVEASCKINRREALRIEVFLADLNELYPENPFTVVDVLQIMYCDFIKAYKSGEMANIVSRICEHLKNDK